MILRLSHLKEPNVLLQNFEHFRDQRVADDIKLAQPDDRDIRHRLQLVRHFRQS